MGKEWYWTGRFSKRGEGGNADAENPSGCMCAFFQFFDFHPLHFPVQQQPPSSKLPSGTPEDQSIPKGAEAPRNSLESEAGTISVFSKEDDLKVPKSIQIKTNRRARGGNGNDLSSEISSSPCTKTPTLVARLMGLDLLPDAQSPSSSSLSCRSDPNTRGNSRLHHFKPRQNILTKPRNSTDSDIAASRSLPETPRISSARRSDVEHRLSLQINKENLGVGEEMELPRFSFSRRKFEEQSCRSPSHYARQIVKQVKESVSRKVGLDITNSVKNREQSREELVSQIRVKKSPKTSLKVIDDSSPGKNPSPPNSSPRLRFMEAKQKPTTKPPLSLTPKDQNSHPVKLPSPQPINIQPQIPRVLILTKSKPRAFAEQELQNQKSVPKCKKDANERFSARLKKPRQTSDIIRNRQEESFVRPPLSPTRANDIKSKTKRTSNLLNLTSIPNLRPVKTDPSPPATKILQRKVPDAQESKRSSQLSSCSRQTYKQEANGILATREGNDQEDDKSNGASTTGACRPPEFEYITKILSRTTGVVSEGARKTVSLDSSIFHHLEQYYYPTSISTVCSVSNVAGRNNQLGLRYDRKLLFDLVNEILGEILKPWVIQHSNHHGSNLTSQLIVEAVYKRIRSFPEANCEVWGDIDALIEREDLGKMMKEGLDCKEKEEEGLVVEIERSILEMLVHEAVGGWGQVSWCSVRRRLDRREGAGVMWRDDGHGW